MELSRAAIDAHPFATLGQTFEPYAIFVYVIFGIGFLAAGTGMLFGWRNTLRALGLMLISGLNCIVVAFTVDDYRLAQLFDAPGVVMGEVAKVAETGGGCTPVRTDVTLKNGTGLTVNGRLSLSPGDQVTRKVTTAGSYVCKGDGETTECKQV